MSPAARATYDSLKGKHLQRVNEAILRIEQDPGWVEGRFVAPAHSQHHGAMVDLTGPYAITYRLIDKGAVVWILSIRAVIL